MAGRRASRRSRPPASVTQGGPPELRCAELGAPRVARCAHCARLASLREQALSQPAPGRLACRARAAPALIAGPGATRRQHLLHRRTLATARRRKASRSARHPGGPATPRPTPQPVALGGGHAVLVQQRHGAGMARLAQAPHRAAARWAAKRRALGPGSLGWRRRRRAAGSADPSRWHPVPIFDQIEPKIRFT